MTEVDPISWTGLRVSQARSPLLLPMIPVPFPLKLLVDNGQLSNDSTETLMAEEWCGLIDDSRRVLLASKLTEVDDADAELD